MAPLSQWLIARWGAQTASLAVAAGVLLLVVAVVLMARGPSSPAEIGVALDGAPQAAGVTPDPDAAEGRAAALRDIPPLTAFIMLVSVVGAGMASIAVLTQEPLLFKQAKLSTEVAALLLGLTAGGGLIGSATIGWMLDRLHGLWSSAVVALTIFLGVLAFSVLLHQPTAVAGALGALSLGYGFGAGEVLWIALTKRQLGQAVFPFTYGAWYFALQVGYGLGGGIAGWSYQSFGAAGFLAFVALIYALPALCSLTLKGGRLPAAGRASS